MGAVKKGKDGNKWIVKEIKNGNKRWVKVNIKEKIQKDLFKKLYKWWLKLSIGGLLVIYKNGKYKFVKSNKKWIELSENKEVVAIIWSGQSYETLHYFSNYLVYKTSKKELDNILKSKKLTDYLIKNYKKYFYKYINKTKKDYMFKGFQKL